MYLPIKFPTSIFIEVLKEFYIVADDDLRLLWYNLKVAFFQKMRFVFLNLQKKIFQKTVLNLKFKFPTNKTLYCY